MTNDCKMDFEGVKYKPEIKTFDFKSNNLNKEIWIYYNEKSNSWPVFYVLRNSKNNEIYVGETTNMNYRIKNHLKSKPNHDKVSIIEDGSFNKSAVLAIESFLIKYLSAENNFQLENSNAGMIHDFYNKEAYVNKFKKEIWPKLMEAGLVTENLQDIENKNLFKYSPYTSISRDQYSVILDILEKLGVSRRNGNRRSFLVKGLSGTGKTILGIYLAKLLSLEDDQHDFEDPDISEAMKNLQGIKEFALVIPQQSLRKTLKNVFKESPGLKANMVISPSEVLKKNYDLLIVDESHRLKRRRNITNYRSFDEANNKLGLGEEGTELDWTLNQSNSQIFFYDEFQSVKPSDISKQHFYEITGIVDEDTYTLESQFRVGAGKDYVKYVRNVLNISQESKENFPDYDFKLFEDINDFVRKVREKEEDEGLSRFVAGYGWKWVSKGDNDLNDIKIEDREFRWNLDDKDWINSANVFENEVGCIHTIQGYDLNYAGVIFGPEISFDKEKGEIVINRENYHDIKGKANVKSDEELKEYILNIYSVLLTRGIKGTYVYVYDKNLRDYLKKYMDVF